MLFPTSSSFHFVPYTFQFTSLLPLRPSFCFPVFHPRLLTSTSSSLPFWLHLSLKCFLYKNQHLYCERSSSFHFLPLFIFLLCVCVFFFQPTFPHLCFLFVCFSFIFVCGKVSLKSCHQSIFLLIFKTFFFHFLCGFIFPSHILSLSPSRPPFLPSLSTFPYHLFFPAFLSNSYPTSLPLSASLLLSLPSLAPFFLRLPFLHYLPPHPLYLSPSFPHSVPPL